MTGTAVGAGRDDGWRRVVLKLSGEAFGGGRVGVDPDVVARVARAVAGPVREGVQVAIVVGGGNYFRGAELSEGGMDRSRADYMGMLGTVMNCLALQDFLEQAGVDTRVQTAITMGQVAEPYVPRRAIRHMEKGRVVIFGAGAGLPYFSTDTVAAQRALEIRADAVLMAKNGVDGVYTADPRKDPNASRLDEVSYGDALRQQLKVVDATAFSLSWTTGCPWWSSGWTTRERSPRRCAVRGSARSSSPDDPPLTALRRPGRVAGRRTDEEDWDCDRRRAPRGRGQDGEGRRRSRRTTSRRCGPGRANPALFAKINVEYYGAMTPLQQLASFNVPEARTVLITPYDKTSIASIEKSLRASDLGVNPSNDGIQIRIILPQLTEERRRDYVKIARSKAEDARVTVRSLRRRAKDELDRVVKDGEAGEDEVARAEKELDAVTRRHVDLIDDLLKHKETELLAV